MELDGEYFQDQEHFIVADWKHDVDKRQALTKMSPQPSEFYDDSLNIIKALSEDLPFENLKLFLVIPTTDAIEEKDRHPCLRETNEFSEFCEKVPNTNEPSITPMPSSQEKATPAPQAAVILV